MKSQQLLEHYERIVDTPDAIARLRRFVLDVAVRGKLVAQNPVDETASDLLKRITAERARLVKAGEINAPKSLARIGRNDLTFAIPQHWEPLKFSEILDEIQTGPFGSSLHQSDYVVGGTPVINPASLQDKRIVPIAKMAVGPSTLKRLSSFKLRSGDIVMARRGEMGRCALVSEVETGWLCGTGSLILRPSKLLYAPFLVLLIGSPFSREYLGGTAVGATMQNLNQSILLNLPFGLPPLAEQRRIVDKVEELMTLCDQLEDARAAREATRDLLAAASLARLNVPDPKTFIADAGFALDAFPSLTARADQIKQFRQTIFNLAVRGKLVQQDQNDGVAIAFDKVAPSEAPFDIPQQWKWARIRALGRVVGGGTPSKGRDDFWGGSIPWVSPKDMKVDYLDRAQMSITKEAIHGSAVNLISSGSILFVVRGMILAHSFPVAVNRVSVTINQDMKALEPKSPEIAEYVLRALKGMKLEMLSRVQRSSHGTCRLESTDYLDFLIPIPPIAEQHRIVAKVDELMALCDQLEASLTGADDTRRRLLDALLAEALQPALQAAA